MSALIDDSPIQSGDDLEIVNRLEAPRWITHVIHDIDGTHSLIRDWPPVMSLSMWYAMHCGFPGDFDSTDNIDRLVGQVGQPVGEFDDITRFFNGYSAITQLEYGIRRGIEEGRIPALDPALTNEDRAANSAILERLRSGEERYPDIKERPAVPEFIGHVTPRLFRFYEALLHRASRDRNTAEARRHPERWRVPGSLEFMRRLHALGLINHFVTGAVVYQGGGMAEEVEVCGYEVGPGKLVESLAGSSWDKKLPKNEVMARLFTEQSLDPRQVLVVGDGRTEIKAGVEFGCPTLSRLPLQEERQREVHRALGVNYIVSDYQGPAMQILIRQA